MRVLRILLADDHEVVRVGLKELLAQPGWEVVDEAATGREAVEKAKRLQPDVVILDISMPGMNGYEVLSKIRDRGDFVPVVALSAMAYDTDRENALQAGFADYITKPILDLEEFKRQVYRHVREQ